MKAYKLLDIPNDIFKLVLDEQNSIKKERKTRSFSFERTIYKMLRDYDKCRKLNNFRPPEE